MIDIYETFEFFGRTFDVRMTEKHGRVEMRANGRHYNAVEITDQYGQIWDWSKVYKGQKGAALEAAERKAAREFLEQSIIDALQSIDVGLTE